MKNRIVRVIVRGPIVNRTLASLAVAAFLTATPAVAETVAHPTGCPKVAFCGCGVSVKIFGRPIRELFLARNWFKFPRTQAAPGMVAVRKHHVMAIEAVDANGNAVVYDPNSGHRKTRIHVRSLAGFVVVNPHGGT